MHKIFTIHIHDIMRKWGTSHKFIFMWNKLNVYTNVVAQFDFMHEPNG